MGVISYILDISYKNTSIHSGGSAVGCDYERSNKALRYKLLSDFIKSHRQARVLTRKFTYISQI